jgi:uncharacterized membrane protein
LGFEAGIDRAHRAQARCGATEHSRLAEECAFPAIGRSARQRVLRSFTGPERVVGRVVGDGHQQRLDRPQANASSGASHGGSNRFAAPVRVRGDNGRRRHHRFAAQQGLRPLRQLAKCRPIGTRPGTGDAWPARKSCRDACGSIGLRRRTGFSAMTFAYAVLLCLHLLAATLWVGGMAVMHLAVRPAAVATLPPPLRLPFMAAALGRFFTWVAWAIVLLLASALAMIMMSGGFAAVHWSVHAMFAAGLLMMAIFGYIRLGPYRRLLPAVAAHRWSEAAPQMNRIRQWVALNLLLGIAVFVLAVVARVL